MRRGEGSGYDLLTLEAMLVVEPRGERHVGA